MPIPYHELVAFAAGEIGGPRALEIEGLLARDPAAARTVARYRAALGATVETPPGELIADAIAIYKPARFADTSPGLIDQVAELVARLVFDSRAEPAPALLRSPTAGFQLTYELVGLDYDARLELEAEPAADESRTWRLVGQVSPAARLRVTDADLCRPGDTTVIATSSVDDRGVFTISAEPGRYDLHFRSAGPTVVAPDVRIP